MTDHPAAVVVEGENLTKPNIAADSAPTGAGDGGKVRERLGRLATYPVSVCVKTVLIGWQHGKVGV